MSKQFLVASATAALVTGFCHMPMTKACSQPANGGEARLLFDPSFLGTNTPARALDPPLPAPASGATGEAAGSPEPTDRSAGAPPLSGLNGRVFNVKAANRPIADLSRFDKKPALLEPERFGRIPGGSFSLALETETKFKPYELPDGQKFQVLDSMRQLRTKPYLGLSLTSPLP
jgi:hypothetical protein